jgi:hypothetical protein
MADRYEEAYAAALRIVKDSGSTLPSWLIGKRFRHWRSMASDGFPTAASMCVTTLWTDMLKREEDLKGR